MTERILYHNPRCSKSRAALELLRERNVELRVVEYLKTPPSREELESLARRLGLSPSAWTRKGEDAFRERGLGASASDAELFDAMAAEPILMERPILVAGERAIVGRPPERVLELL